MIAHSNTLLYIQCNISIVHFSSSIKVCKSTALFSFFFSFFLSFFDSVAPLTPRNFLDYVLDVPVLNFNFKMAVSITHH